ncbi:MAG: DNA polymerase IV, partial [Acidimicrobiales bacterium]
MDGTAAGWTGRAVLHVDLDCFYAAVEVRRDPSLQGLPVVVGGTGERGVVAAASYEARLHGVRSAMPTVQARRLCPHAVFLDGHPRLYEEHSRRFREILESFTPLVEPLALDEAFLDVTGSQRLWGEPVALARRLRDAVLGDLGLRCSVGVGATKLVAKLASKGAKPQISGGAVRPGKGVLCVLPGSELEFLHPLPVTALSGVGPATAAKLSRLGVTKVADLARVPAPSLVRALGRAGAVLAELAWGRDPRPVEPSRPTKSVGHEETYARDLVERAEVLREALRLSDGVAARLCRLEMAARTVTVKVRF